jgi:hypothetical protein
MPGQGHGSALPTGDFTFSMPSGVSGGDSLRTFKRQKTSQNRTTVATGQDHIFDQVPPSFYGGAYVPMNAPWDFQDSASSSPAEVNWRGAAITYPNTNAPGTDVFGGDWPYLNAEVAGTSTGWGTMSQADVASGSHPSGSGMAPYQDQAPLPYALGATMGEPAAASQEALVRPAPAPKRKGKSRKGLRRPWPTDVDPPAGAGGPGAIVPEDPAPLAHTPGGTTGAPQPHVGSSSTDVHAVPGANAIASSSNLREAPPITGAAEDDPATGQTPEAPPPLQPPRPGLHMKPLDPEIDLERYTPLRRIWQAGPKKPRIINDFVCHIATGGAICGATVRGDAAAWMAHFKEVHSQLDVSGGCPWWGHELVDGQMRACVCGCMAEFNKGKNKPRESIRAHVWRKLTTETFKCNTCERVIDGRNMSREHKCEDKGRKTFFHD